MTCFAKPRCSFFPGLPHLRRLLLAGAVLLPLAAAPQVQANQLSTDALKQQCQSLMNGSQSLMSAFQSGQCSSYILGIYDLVMQQCPQLNISRQQAVSQALDFLSRQPGSKQPAVTVIDHFFARKGQCLPVASL